MSPAAHHVEAEEGERKRADRVHRNPAESVVGENAGEQERHREANVSQTGQPIPAHVPRQFDTRKYQQETAEDADSELRELFEVGQRARSEQDEKTGVQQQHERSEPLEPPALRSARGCADDRRFHDFVLIG